MTDSMTLLCDNCGNDRGSKKRFCSARCEKDLAFRAIGTTKARRRVAVLFQRMIRAEYGAKPAGPAIAVQSGQIVAVDRKMGQCVCVTCGRVAKWDAGLRVMHTGHFVSGRSASIVFDERNVAPQCSHCNVYRHGAAAEFAIWMVATHSTDVIDELRQKRHAAAAYDRSALVDMWFAFASRLKTAQDTMKRAQ